MNQHDDLYPELVVGRVLDALEPGDEALLTAHLEGCAGCRDLLHDMLHTAAALAYDVEQVEPPAELLERIRTALPARVVAGSGADAVTDLGAGRARRVSGGRLRGHRRPSTPVMRATARAVIGVAAAAALFFGGFAWHAAEHRVPNAKAFASDQLVLQHLKSGAAYSVGLVSGGAATGTAVVDGRSVDLIASGLGRNDASDSIYVLWAAAPGSSRMTAVTGFDVTSDGLTVVHATLPAGLLGPTTFGVTHESGRTLPKSPGQAVLGVRST